MALIQHNRAEGSPGIHALLIGVGNYPELKPRRAPVHQAPPMVLDDLTSPQKSVKALAAWIETGLNITNLPLRSLRVLCSSPDEAPPWPDCEPSIDNIEQDVHAWFDDVNSHEDNLALFYFCGHGLRVGDIHAVLAQDFGTRHQSLFQRSFDPESFADSMRKAKARRQIFLVDACSSSTPATEQYEGISPRTLIEAERHKHLGVVKQTYLRASEFGLDAYGTDEGPTLFVSAFLQAMKGAATLPSDAGRWVVKTNALRTALNWIIQRQGHSLHQEVDYGARMSADIPFHELIGLPRVPVEVVCSPSNVSVTASLHIDGEKSCEPSQSPWLVDLNRGAYEFSAVDGSCLEQPTKGSLRDSVHPPFHSVCIPCEEGK